MDGVSVGCGEVESSRSVATSSSAMKRYSLFSLSLWLSQVRRYAYIPEHDPRQVMAWLESAEPSMVLRVMLDILQNALQTRLLSEDQWVTLVSHMGNHPLLLLASALALAFVPESILLMELSVGTVSPEDTSPHQEEGLEKEELVLVLEPPDKSLALLLQEAAVGREEYAQTSDEGAAAEEQPIVLCRVLCYTVWVQKVINPLLLEDQKRGQGGRIASGSWGMFLSGSREQHIIEREKFMAELRPPQTLRVIDCQQSVKKGVVVLIDRHEDTAYTAISHTYGLDVYKVYDCGCATTYMGEGKARANPAKTPCNGHHGPDEHKQTRVMNDMLNMCKILVEKGGVQYAWHDGICIAQYDEEDVTDAIQHMGWIYANAEDTVIFLHYAGQAIAPIGTGSDPIPLVARWQTRAWTFQEAVLSKHRRYCVLRGDSNLGSCVDWQDFEDRLALWYVPGQSTIEILEEADFFHSVLLLLTQMRELRKKGEPNPIGRHVKVNVWMKGLANLLHLLHSGLFFFVTPARALTASSLRDSKHPGDRINCILALAGVQEFSVHKDENVEQSTLEFFKRIGKKGLEFAVFTPNSNAPPSLEECSMHRLTWLPSLCGMLGMSYPHLQDGEDNFNTSQIEFKVLEKNSHIELTGPLVCVSVRFYWKKSESQSEAMDVAESSRAAAPVTEEVSDLAHQLHRPDDNLGIFLQRQPAKRGACLASELGASGALLGEALFPDVYADSWTAIKDMETMMEFLDIVHHKKGKSLLEMRPLSESDDAYLLFRDDDKLTLKEMDWREAWAYFQLHRQCPHTLWNEAALKFFFKCTELREALTQCGKFNSPGLMLCLQEFCDFPTVHTFVQVDPLQRRKVGSFRASLVFPAEVLSRNSADFRRFGFPTLVINGDCNDSPVTKIGCFTGFEVLHRMLVSKHINFEHLTELEIR